MNEPENHFDWTPDFDELRMSEITVGTVRLTIKWISGIHHGCCEAS